MTFSAYMPSIKEVVVGTKYILNGVNNENYKLFGDAYDDSVTNSACINDISNLVVGEGLIDASNTHNPYINISEQDFNLAVLDYEKQGACTFEIVWGSENKPAKIFHKPIETIGLNVNENQEINGYWYSYDWCKKWKYVPQFYTKFNGEKPENGVSILRIVRPSNEPLFPRPHWFPALRWAQDEGLMAQHSFSDIKTGFSGQKVINWAGGRGLTDAQKDDAATKLRDKFSGINGQRIVVSVGNSPENAVIVDNIDPPNVNATYVNYTEEAERKILIAHSYPAILLAGSKTGFSSNADEIAVATKSVFRRKINPDRNVILSELQKVFKLIEPSIVLDCKNFDSDNLDTNTK